MVRLAGLEPVTPTMSRWCSNQLSYSRNLRENEANYSEVIMFSQSLAGLFAEIYAACRRG